MKPDLYGIQSTIGYEFREPGILLQAFVSPDASCRPDRTLPALIGGAALDLAIAYVFCSIYGGKAQIGGFDCLGLEHHEWRESKLRGGDISKIRQALSESGYLTLCLRSLGFHEYLNDAHGEDASSDGNIEKLLETILGAVAIDSCYDMHAVFRTAELLIDFDSYMFQSRIDGEKYIISLRDHALQTGIPLPVYLCKPDAFDHCLCELTLPGTGLSFHAAGRSGISARRAAAREAYFALLQSGEIKNAFRDAVGAPDPEDHAGQLRKLASLGLVGEPVFTLSRTDGNLPCGCTLTVPGCEVSVIVEADSDEDAVRECAFELMRYLTCDFDPDD